MIAIFQDTEFQLKPHERAWSDRPSGLIIYVGLDGLRGAEIIAADSDAESKLLQLWGSFHPALEAQLEQSFSGDAIIEIAEQTRTKI